MNILFYSYFGFNPKNGGIERVSNILAEEFQKLGHNVYFIKRLKGQEDDSYVPVTEEVQLPCDSKKFSKKCADFFTEYVESRKIDVIICQHSTDLDHYSPYMAKMRTGAKLLYGFHTTPLLHYLEIENLERPVLPTARKFKYEYKRITRRIFKKIKQKSRIEKMGKHIRLLHEWGDGIVFLSKSYVDTAISLTGLPNADRLYAIGNPNTYMEADIKECLKENTLLFVGRLAREKSPGKALVLWKRLQSRFPNWNLKIVGDGLLKEDMENMVDKWHLERCYIEGRKDPSQYYAQSKILMLLSDFEGFPMILNEAMIHGTVPVAFNSFGALKDIISDGETGFSVTSYDLDEFEEKLSSLMQDEERLSKMSAAAKIATERYDREVIARQWIELFEKIGAGK